MYSNTLNYIFNILQLQSEKKNNFSVFEPHQIINDW